MSRLSNNFHLTHDKTPPTLPQKRAILVKIKKSAPLLSLGFHPFV